MKRILIFLLLTASVALAGTYSITTNTAQDNRLERARVRWNRDACATALQPPSCTQAQARNVNPSVDIYSDVTDFLTRKVVKDYTDSLKQADTSDDEQQAIAAWNAKTAAQKDAVCALFSLPNGCEVFPR